jgi:hypothetical protein
MFAAALDSRFTTRALIVSGTLGLVFAGRLDRAIKTAYESHWATPGGDLRLPTSGWSAFHVGVGVLAILLFVAAALLWRRRECGQILGGDLGRTSVVISVLAVVFAGVGGVGRLAAAHDSGKGSLTLALVFNGLALASVLALALVNGNLFSAGPYGIAGLFKRLLERQRMNLLIVLGLVGALTFLGDTSGQAIDSIRSWTPLVFDEGGARWSSQGAARLTLGLAAALLLALVVYESGVRLTQVGLASHETNFRGFGGIGAGIALLGALLWWLLPFGPGLLLIGLFLVAIALLEVPNLEPEGEVLPAGPIPAERHAPEWLAIAPLLGLAATSVTATVEAGLSGGVGWNALLTAFPAFALGALAVLLTGRPPLGPRWMVGVPGWTLIGLAAGIVVLSLAVLFVGETWLAAVWGLFWLVLLVGYALLLFHHRRDWELPWPAVTVPITLGGGIAALIGINADPLKAGQTLGVFTVSLLALAFALLGLHLAVRATLHRRPPRLLWWFGLRQLPVLTLLLAWWLAVGLVQTFIGPKSLHDVRLLDRVPVAAIPAGEATPLERAFDQWVRSQADLAGPASEDPVPLVLVAAHGGGIRAAYWTAAALDCLVGVSAENVDPARLESEDEEVRAAARSVACTSRRRTKGEQRVAARRIFMASGVSGGAVGLYAYARQLLQQSWLGATNKWLDKRLGADFASPAVGWGLFHDAPNRLFGLHPATGAPCGWKLLEACLRQNRAAVLEETFDAEWDGRPSSGALLRRSYELRFVRDPRARQNGGLVPLLVMNATLTGGQARAVVSPVNLGSWPYADADDPERGNDRLPLAGTVEVRDALCESSDVRLSTAALLAARFPYVTPSGRMPGRCGDDGKSPQDQAAPCANEAEKRCEGRFVDGGYAENSGLFTLVAVWPSLRSLIVDYNMKARVAGRREIAPMIVEIDNHYQASLRASVPSQGSAAETLIPPATAFGSRRAMETFARASAYRILPSECTLTISPSLHPGLIAPLGWELSEAARDDLLDGLIRAHPADETGMVSARRLRQVQARIAAPSERKVVVGKDLGTCLPRLPATEIVD